MTKDRDDLLHSVYLGKLETLEKYDSTGYDGLDAQIYGNIKKFGPDAVCKFCVLRVIYCGHCPLKKDLHAAIEKAKEF